MKIDPENSEFSRSVLKSIRRTPSSPASVGSQPAEFGAEEERVTGAARGEARPASDIDLAVAGIAPARFFDAAAAAFADVRCATVDLAPLDALHPHIRARVDAEGVVLVG